MIFGCGSPAFALEMQQVNNENTAQRQFKAAILSVDKEALKRDALNNVVDISVPESVRDSVYFGAEITVDDPAYENMYEIGEIYSTVQKVSEIDYGDGKVGTVYVATTATEIKSDYGFGDNLGAKAWTTVYWIDNLGVDNELYAVEASWDTSNCTYETGNKFIEYGTVLLGSRVFLDSTVVSVADSETSQYIDCQGEYSGFSFGCMSQMDVGPSPVKVTSWAITSLA